MLKKLLPILLLLLSTQTVCGQLLCRFTVSDTAGCSPLIIHFTDSSTGNPTSWYWDFGNGDTSNLQNPVDSFIDSGTYHIFLRISNSNSTDSQYLSIHIFPKPILSFAPSSTFAQCPPFPVQYTNTSSKDTINTKWYFGDGDTSSAVNPYHIYKYPQTYSVTLLAQNSYGCAGSVTYHNLIQVKGPIGNFTASVDSGCPPLVVTFTGMEQSVLNSLFVSGDGYSTQDTINIPYTYTDSGMFYPTYTLIDSFECAVSYLADSIHVLNCDTSSNGISSELESYLSVGPNPATTSLTITTNANQPLKIGLFDVAGKEWLIDYLTESKALNISGLANGIYLLRIEDIDTKQFITKKVVILH